MDVMTEQINGIKGHWVDPHCHLDHHGDERIDLDWKNARQSGVTQFILGGTSPQNWPRHREVAQRYDGVYWTAGCHPVFAHEALYHPSSPEESQRQANSWFKQLEQTIKAQRSSTISSSRLVGIGEVGLDRAKRRESSIDLQLYLMRLQLNLARTTQLPVVLHVVRAHGLALNVLQDLGPLPAGGIVHAFSGSYEVAQAYLKLGLIPSIGAAALHPGSRKSRRMLTQMKLGEFLIETDAPDQPVMSPTSEDSEQAHYLLPHHSGRLTEIARQICDIRSNPHESVMMLLTTSSMRVRQMFNLPRNG